MQKVVIVCGGYAGRLLLSYRYQEKGYLASLGSSDAVGGIGTKCHRVKRLRALIAKELLEKQYELHLHGVNTYI